MKLAAMDEDAGGIFTIRFTGSDADGDRTTLALYYDTDRNPGRSDPIASGLSLAAGQYQWNTAGVPPGCITSMPVSTDGTAMRPTQAARYGSSIQLR